MQETRVRSLGLAYADSSAACCTLRVVPRESPLTQPGYECSGICSIRWRVNCPDPLTCYVSGWHSGGGTNHLTWWQFCWVHYLCSCCGPEAVTLLTQVPWTHLREAARLVMWPRWVSYKMTFQQPESHHTFQGTCHCPRGKADSCKQIYSRSLRSTFFGE